MYSGCERTIIANHAHPLAESEHIYYFVKLIKHTTPSCQFRSGRGELIYPKEFCIAHTGAPASFLWAHGLPRLGYPYAARFLCLSIRCPNVWLRATFCGAPCLATERQLGKNSRFNSEEICDSEQFLHGERRTRIEPSIKSGCRYAGPLSNYRCAHPTPSHRGPDFTSNDLHSPGVVIYFHVDEIIFKKDQ